MQWLIIVSFLWLPEVIVCPYVTYERHNPQYPDPEPDTELYDGGDYGGYGSYDYGKSYHWEYKLEKIEPKPVVLECYTCTYTKMEYHEHGMPNCDEPFQDHGVPVVTCQGLCAKTKSVIGDGEYMMIRSCLPDCKTIYDDLSTTECCYGNKCNGAIRSAAALHSKSAMGYFTKLIILFCVLQYLMGVNKWQEQFKRKQDWSYILPGICARSCLISSRKKSCCDVNITVLKKKLKTFI